MGQTTSRTTAIPSAAVTRFSPHYSVLEKVQDPHFGEVQVIQEEGTYQRMLLKEILLTTQKAFDAELDYFIKRVQVSHPNIIKILGFSSDTEFGSSSVMYKIKIFIEKLDKDLHTKLVDHMKTGTLMSEQDLLLIAENLISALSYLQDMGIAHSDVRPFNIFSSYRSYKLFDLCLSGKKGHNGLYNAIMHKEKVYLAPELMSKVPLHQFSITTNKFKNDVYALGITLLSLASLTHGEDLYDYHSGTINTNLVQGRLGIIKSNYSAFTYELIKEMLYSEDKRPEPKELHVKLLPYQDNIKFRLGLPFVKRSNPMAQSQIVTSKSSTEDQTLPASRLMDSTGNVGFTSSGNYTSTSLENVDKPKTVEDVLSYARKIKETPTRSLDVPVTKPATTDFSKDVYYPSLSTTANQAKSEGTLTYGAGGYSSEYLSKPLGAEKIKSTPLQLDQFTSPTKQQPGSSTMKTDYDYYTTTKQPESSTLRTDMGTYITKQPESSTLKSDFDYYRYDPHLTSSMKVDGSKIYSRGGFYLEQDRKLDEQDPVKTGGVIINISDALTPLKPEVHYDPKSGTSYSMLKPWSEIKTDYSGIVHNPSTDVFSGSIKSDYLKYDKSSAPITTAPTTTTPTTTAAPTSKPDYYTLEDLPKNYSRSYDYKYTMPTKSEEPVKTGGVVIRPEDVLPSRQDEVKTTPFSNLTYAMLKPFSQIKEEKAEKEYSAPLESKKEETTTPKENPMAVYETYLPPAPTTTTPTYEPATYKPYEFDSYTDSYKPKTVVQPLKLEGLVTQDNDPQSSKFSQDTPMFPAYKDYQFTYPNSAVDTASKPVGSATVEKEFDFGFSTYTQKESSPLMKENVAPASTEKEETAPAFEKLKSALLDISAKFKPDNTNPFEARSKPEDRSYLYQSQKLYEPVKTTYETTSASAGLPYNSSSYYSKGAGYAFSTDYNLVPTINTLTELDSKIDALLNRSKNFLSDASMNSVPSHDYLNDYRSSTDKFTGIGLSSSINIYDHSSAFTNTF